MNIKIDAVVCRVCLKPNIGSNHSIFSADTLERFRFATLVQVEENDGLPQIICQHCFAKLKTAYEFRRQALESDEHYRKFIQDVNKKFQSLTHVGSHDYVEEEEEVIEDDNDNDNIYVESDLKEQVQDQDEDHNDDGEVEIMDDEAVNIIDMLTIKNEKNGKLDDTYITEEHMIEDEQEVLLADYNEEQLMDTDDDDETRESAYIDVHDIQENVNENDDGEADVDGDDGKPLESEQMFDEEHLDNQVILFYDGNIEGTMAHTRSKSETSSTNFCMKCNKDFSTRTNLTRHMATHDGQKPFACEICGNRFTQNGSLKSHMLIHTGERPFVCAVCSKGFTQSKSLAFHMRRHTGEKPFSCDHCGMHFRQKDGLKRHLATKHSTDDPPKFPCDLCGRILLSKSSHRFHLSKHSAVKQEDHKCGECGKMFASKTTLAVHMKQHGANNQKSQTFKKSFVCHVCGKSYTQKSQLNSHLEKHKADGPAPEKLACTMCPKTFTLQRSLLNHIKTHTIDESSLFKCDDCNVGFDNARNLKLHRKSQHHEMVPDLNGCNICGTVFVHVSDLNTHMGHCHPEGILA